jgi:hypothetical protein
MSTASASDGSGLTRPQILGPETCEFAETRRVDLILSEVATIVSNIKNLRERRTKMKKQTTVDMFGVVRDVDGFCVECAVEYCECEI